MSVFATAVLSFLLQALSVQGTVIRKGSTEPLSRATVELRRDQENGAVIDSAMTEEDGRFSFAVVAPGRYRLTATRRGYTRPPLVITVSANEPVQNIRVPMTATAAISGRVVGVNGRPLGNVEVRALKAAYPEGQRVLTPVQSVQTNDLGEYRLFFLAPGRYYVAALHPKTAGLSTRMTDIITVEKADPANAVLHPRADLESATERYAPIFFGGTTDEHTAIGIDLREGADFGGVEIVVGPLQMRHVRGIVVDGITRKPAQYPNLSVTRDVKIDRDTSTFEMLLFPGTYAVTATSASGEGYAAFTVGDADIENLIIPTTPTFNIRGRIIVEGGPLSPAALSALGVTLRRDPPLGQPQSGAYETPLADGSFTLNSSAGNYRVNIAGIQDAYVKSIRLGNADVLNDGLRLTGPPSGVLEVVIARNGGAIEGQVVRNGREIVTDAAVLLVPDNPRRVELYRTTITDGAGRFEFDRVPPGSYKVLSWQEVEEGFWFDPYFMTNVESRALRVRISEGATETTQVEVIPGP